MKVHPDVSHSTEAVTIEGSVWEVVFQSDEAYWHVAMLTDRAAAEQLALWGNGFMYGPDVESRDIGFEIREHKLVTALHRPWTRQDFIDEIDGWELEDYLLPEPEEGE